MLDSGRLVMASAHQEIRRPENPPPGKGGHLVLVTGRRGDTVHTRTASLPAAAEEDAAPPDGSVTDWPEAGRSAYLRLRAGDPFVVEVRDPVQSGVTVTVPLNLPDGWATRAASRLDRVRTTLTGGD